MDSEIIEGLRRSGIPIWLARFPDAPSAQYEWRRQLDETSSLAMKIGADWILHYDADEVRQSPWRGISLRDAFARLSAHGYSASDFTVIEFRYLIDRPDPIGPYQRSLTHFEFARRPGCFKQVKAWAQNGNHVALADGGHSAEFDGRRVYPLKFLNKHYPLRNRIQSTKKIHKDRLPRFAAERAAHGWHTHYDKYAQMLEIEGWDRRDLIPWNPCIFEAEYLIERLSGIGIQE